MLEDGSAGDDAWVCAGCKVEEDGGCCDWHVENDGESGSDFIPDRFEYEYRVKDENGDGADVPAGIGCAVLDWSCYAYTAVEAICPRPNLM
jgi:hypothetical protein